MSKGLRFSQAEFDAMQKGRGAGRKANSAVAPTAKQKLQALGRLAPGTMNKGEQRFAEYLEWRKHIGEIVWYRFESIKLRLAKSTFLDIDFFLMLSTGELQAIDVKGARAIVEEDSKVKMKIAADIYPWPFFYAYPKKPASDGWDIEQV